MDTKKIYLSSPHMGENELKNIHEAFDTNWISTVGPQINKFEEVLSNYTGTKYAAVLASGTAALHLALKLTGTQPGDYVLCQSFTFAASANPITYLGAHPVYIDSEEHTWNLDPVALRNAISEIEDKIKKEGNGAKISAIIPVHLYGMPANMPEINKIAKKHHIPVIEDAAEALGSKIGFNMCGNLGDLGVISFNGNKIITTSGGGALLSNNQELIEKTKFLATQARDPAPHYEHTQIGYNYRMGNINAAIGIGQMDVLNDRVAKRREIFNEYFNEFKNKYKFQNSTEKLPNGTKTYSNRWLTTILTDSFEEREYLRNKLEKNNIECRPLWKPMHLQPVYKESRYFGNRVSENLFEKGLCLPSGSNMSLEDRDRIMKTIKE